MLSACSHPRIPAIIYLYPIVNNKLVNIGKWKDWDFFYKAPFGIKVRPTAGAYAGTKYAIEALTEALRLELAKTDIGVACIEPGLVQTELHRDWKVPPAQGLNIPRPLQPEDIARVVRFMLEQPDHVRLPRILAVPADQELCNIITAALKRRSFLFDKS